MNRPLKAAIFLRFGSQSDAAQALRLAESRLSRIIRERVQPSKKERQAFTKVFGENRATELLGTNSEEAS